MMVRKTRQEYMMIGLDRGIEFYLSTLATEGKSPSYISGLKIRQGYFLEYIEEEYGRVIQVQDLTVEDGRGFLRMLQSRKVKYADHPMREPVEKGLKPHYIHGCGRAVRSFSTWAYEEGYLEENVMRRLKLPKLPQTQPEPLTEDEIKAAITACLVFSKEYLRNYAMLLLFLDTGIRLGELVKLKIPDVDFTAGEMKVFGKGSKERTIPVGRQARRALVEYLSKERPEPKNPQEEDRAFLTADGYGISKSAIHQVFRRIKEEAGLRKFHPHILRHTFAVRFLMNGGDAFSLQKMLGAYFIGDDPEICESGCGGLEGETPAVQPGGQSGFSGE